MTTVADIIQAIDAEGSTSWQIADAVAALDEIDETTGRPKTLRVVADEIGAAGRGEWSPSTLGKYRTTAQAFSGAAYVCRSSYSFSVCQELRSAPDKLRNWKPTKDGDVLTVERARALRGRSSAAKTAPLNSRLTRLITNLDDLAEHDPALVLDTVDAESAQLRTKYAKKIAEGKRHGLAAV